MLMVILMGCADFQGTDFRQGWTEVECLEFEDSGRWDFTLAEPKPVQVWLHRASHDDETDGWYQLDYIGLNGKRGYVYDGTDYDACRAWVAE